MVRATHIFRRGAIYYWRKRILIGTLKNGPNTYLQVSLCVSELKAAKHIAVSVNFESERSALIKVKDTELDARILVALSISISRRQNSFYFTVNHQIDHFKNTQFSLGFHLKH